MKKLLIFLLSVCSLNFSAGAIAVEDWQGVFDGYNEAEYGKPVTGEDYTNAIKTLEKYREKNKGKKSKQKEKTDNKNKEENNVIFDLPSSHKPLLALSRDVNYKGLLIQRGFYLASAINRDNKHFIRLTQGEGRVIADIEANPLKGENSDNKIFSEIMENDILKLTYIDKDIILEAYLWTR